MAERFWAEHFGIEPSIWQQPGVSVRPHVGLGDYCGLWSFSHGERVVVSAPPSWLARVEALARGADAQQLLELSWWRSGLGSDFERGIGPAYQGCLAPTDFRPAPDPAVRLLERESAPVLAELRATVPEAAWDDSGLDGVQGPFAFRRDNGRVVAACGYRSRNDDVGDLCVLVHPDEQGRGFGTAVVSAVASAALARGKLVIYQTLESYAAPWASPGGSVFASLPAKLRCGSGAPDGERVLLVGAGRARGVASTRHLASAALDAARRAARLASVPAGGRGRGGLESALRLAVRAR
jgi:GNAT superfamily N-acetyltransferase